MIGEAPGADEDAQGVPFVGAAGQLLDWALREAGVTRRATFITNTVACRPPENRDPRLDEQELCWPRVVGIVEAIRPKAVMIIGKPAAQFILHRRVYIKTERGSICEAEIGDATYPAFLAFHPAFVLRNAGANFQPMRRLLAVDIAEAWHWATGERRVWTA